MKSIKTTAIVLSSKIFFEKDKRIELFSPEFGKHTALAKGALGKGKKATGVLECSNIVSLVLSPGKSFSYINQASIIKSFPNIRSSFNRISTCQYFFSIIKYGTIFNQQNETLFHLLENAVELLNATEDYTEVKGWFQYQFLAMEGLVSDTQPTLTDIEFKKILFEYTGKMVTEPILI
jgi:DNA repair protein RecO (recombination protein O)